MTHAECVNLDLRKRKDRRMMNNQTELQKVSEETMRFMRGKYILDEVAYGTDCLKFRQGKKTILSISICEDHYEFQVIFGKVEREKFEVHRSEFPQKILDIYDEAHTYHDGKWMFIRVADMETLESVKELILIKKKPNRKPFPKEQAVLSRCGMRCDLCVHYTGGTISEEFRKELKERIRCYYNDEDNYGENMMLCSGGYKKDCGDCHKRKCSKEKGLDGCPDCNMFPCGDCGIVCFGIEARSTSGDDITWAVLPYVDGQYGN